jgi:hypothetical protein
MFEEDPVPDLIGRAVVAVIRGDREGARRAILEIDREMLLRERRGKLAGC